jgi:hypothetical protein
MKSNCFTFYDVGLIYIIIYETRLLDVKTYKKSKLRSLKRIDQKWKRNFYWIVDKTDSPAATTGCKCIFISMKYFTFHYNFEARYSVTWGNIITHKINRISCRYSATINGQYVSDWVSVTDIGHQILGAIMIKLRRFICKILFSLWKVGLNTITLFPPFV